MDCYRLKKWAEEDRKEVESQAATDSVSLEAAGGAVVEVIARPIVIESNLTGENIDVRLPLD